MAAEKNSHETADASATLAQDNDDDATPTTELPAACGTEASEGKEIVEDDGSVASKNILVTESSSEKNEDSGNKQKINTAEEEDPSTSPVNSDHAKEDPPLAAAAVDSTSLLSLPLDSLHQIASFLTPQEWCVWGQACAASRKIARQVIRRVAMHGFKCAVEVITAYHYCGQQADALELAKLYIKSGVPIYPHCYGHAYRTILWRMKVETTATLRLQQQQMILQQQLIQQQSLLDPFGLERLNFRSSEGYRPELTYAEEKALFWREQNKQNVVPSAGVLGGVVVMDGGANAPSPTSVRQRGRDNSNGSLLIRIAEEESRLEGGAGGVGDAQPLSSESIDNPAVLSVVPIHSHLLDQHWLGQYCVDADGSGSTTGEEDEDGRNSRTPPISLSADFFHPSRHYRTAEDAAGVQGGGTRTEADALHEDTDVVVAAAVLGAAPAAADEDDLANNNNNDAPPLPVNDEDNETPPRLLPPPSALRLKEALDRTEFKVYTSASIISADIRDDSNNKGGSSKDKHNHHHRRRHDASSKPTLAMMRANIAAYERKLGMFLSRSDYHGFDECLMDFWDEYFTQTAYMHYFDQQTAVPRSTCLDKFLTRPCPKAVGIIQCEIERIKIASKGNKGVKGRFFPTYEYRLFIRQQPQRDVPGGSSDEDDESFVRKDLLLLVAKHQGRSKHIPQSWDLKGSKKAGANNYGLYLPQQDDIEAHFTQVNGNKSSEAAAELRSLTRMLANDDDGPSAPVLMGRLQGNFIGTEFQLFVPRPANDTNGRRSKLRQSSSSMRVTSDDEEYDSGVSSDTTTSRRSRFGRFLRTSSSSEQGFGGGGSSRRSRSASAPRSPQPVVERRPNRRAIANENLSPHQQPHSDVVEEEDGVITYTANLLGSRPRIMDVCIPKVSSDGVVGAEWKRYLEECAAEDATEDSPQQQQQQQNHNHQQQSSMLHCFKQLQQRLEALDPQQPRQQGELQQEADQEIQAPANPQQQPPQLGTDNEDVVGNGGGGDTAEPDFGLLALQNRPPWWNVELGSFVLNFGGRVSVASVKNFQLCDRNNQDDIMLQFGRIQGRHAFTMDFQHPLTAVQAFSIAISSLQSKISFG